MTPLASDFLISSRLSLSNSFKISSFKLLNELSFETDSISSAKINVPVVFEILIAWGCNTFQIFSVACFDNCSSDISTFLEDLSKWPPWRIDLKTLEAGENSNISFENSNRLINLSSALDLSIVCVYNLTVFTNYFYKIIDYLPPIAYSIMSVTNKLAPASIINFLGSSSIAWSRSLLANLIISSCLMLASFLEVFDKIPSVSFKT